MLFILFLLLLLLAGTAVVMILFAIAYLVNKLQKEDNLSKEDWRDVF